MQTLYALVLAMIAAPAQAAAGTAPFPEVQETCVEAGAVKLGTHGRWSTCAVTKARWMATMDLIDQYQVQYCLSSGEPGCDHRAFLVFGNRAYTPHAQLLLQRIEPGTAQYEDPLIVKTAYGRLLAIAAVREDGERKVSYYRWTGRGWTSVEAKSWMRETAAKLPRGTRLPAGLAPDIDTMTAHGALQRDDGSATRQQALVELAVKSNRFVVKRVKVMAEPREHARPPLLRFVNSPGQ